MANENIEDLEIINKRILAELYALNEGKHKNESYFLWFVLGWLGGHRFYFLKIYSAIGMFLLFLFGFILTILSDTAFFLLPWAIWVIIDAYLIPRWAEKSRYEHRQRIYRIYDLSSLSALAISSKMPPAS